MWQLANQALTQDAGGDGEVEADRELDEEAQAPGPYRQFLFRWDLFFKALSGTSVSSR